MLKTGWIVEFYAHAPMAPVAWFADLEHARAFVAAHGGLAVCYLHPANERNEEAEVIAAKLTEAEKSVERESRASYSEGYDYGYIDGVSEGRGETAAKLAVEREAGRKEGYDEGYAKGFENGRKEGDKGGYERGCYESVRRLLIAKQSIDSIKCELERVAGELL